MLQILRNKAQSTVIQAIVVVIALVFVFWGVGSNLMNSREAALTVNGSEITFQDFQIAYDRAYENMANQFGGTLPKGMAETLGIKQQVINQLIQAELLRQGAAEMGIIVSKEEIREAINEMPQFQENGLFSMEKYKSLLASNRLTAGKFETNMGFDMLTEKTIGAIGNFVTSAAKFEVEEFYRQDNKKVAVQFISMGPENFKASVEIDEAELQKWFDENNEQYRTEPQIQLKYIAFSFDKIGEKITIDESKVQEYYETNKERFTTPERRHARHILIKTAESDSEEVLKEKEQRANEVLTLAKASDDFATLAKEYSEGPSASAGGDLGLFAKGQMVPAFENAVFSMQPGEISDLVKTQFGYHIIKLEEIQPASTRTFNEVQDGIIASLQLNEAKPMALNMANGAYEGIIGAGSLKAYGEANKDQEIITTDFFTRSAPPADLAGDQAFLEKAFALKAGELSSIVSTDRGHFILFAEKIQEPQTPPLADVKEQVTKDFTTAKATEQAAAAAKSSLERITAGEQFADVAKELDLQVEQSGLLDRNGQTQSTFPAALIADAFTLYKSEPYPLEPGMAGDKYYVYMFDSQEIPAVEESTDLSRYEQMLMTAKQQELLGAYLTNLQKKAEITQHTSL